MQENVALMNARYRKPPHLEWSTLEVAECVEFEVCDQTKFSTTPPRLWSLENAVIIG